MFIKYTKLYYIYFGTSKTVKVLFYTNKWICFLYIYYVLLFFKFYNFIFNLVIFL